MLNLIVKIYIFYFKNYLLLSLDLLSCINLIAHSYFVLILIIYVKSNDQDLLISFSQLTIPLTWCAFMCINLIKDAINQYILKS